MKQCYEKSNNDIVLCKNMIAQLLAPSIVRIKTVPISSSILKK